MAWNDPGKNENPWQRKPDQGPPDLDEMLRRFQKKLRSMFGGGPHPVGSGAGGGGRAIGIGYIVAGVLIVWAMTGIYQNDAAERSVITRNTGGSWYSQYPMISSHDDTPIVVVTSTIQ